MVNKATSIRLDDESRKLLDALSVDLGGVSQSDVVRMALRDMAKARGIIETKKVRQR